MKGNKFNYDQELGLAEIQPLEGAGGLATSRLVELEWQMTNSSFAHHYALSAMTERPLSEDERDGLLEDVEQFKHVYFNAREEYAGIDGDRLDHFESSLVAQKAFLSANSSVSMAH